MAYATDPVRYWGHRIVAELPTVAELLALSVSAGEGVVGAIDRVARLAHGELVHELQRALAETRAGAPLIRALEGVAARTSIPAVGRFVDGIVIALDRGTLLAEVLRAQAGDVREARKRALLEEGGRREIAMMVPVLDQKVVRAAWGRQEAHDKDVVREAWLADDDEPSRGS